MVVVLPQRVTMTLSEAVSRMGGGRASLCGHPEAHVFKVGDQRPLQTDVSSFLRWRLTPLPSPGTYQAGQKRFLSRGRPGCAADAGLCARGERAAWTSGPGGCGAQGETAGAGGPSLFLRVLPGNVPPALPCPVLLVCSASFCSGRGDTVLSPFCVPGPQQTRSACPVVVLHLVVLGARRGGASGGRPTPRGAGVEHLPGVLSGVSGEPRRATGGLAHGQWCDRRGRSPCHAPTRGAGGLRGF